MKLYIGVTNNDWFEFLARHKPDEVNFWRPGGQAFNVLEPGGLFLFKLHSPLNFIAGGGFFVRYSRLPVSLAWEAFGIKNGAPDYETLLQMIQRYRTRSNSHIETDPVIGCIILTSPFFFERSEWIPVPPDWKPNIVQGKSYETDSFVGRSLMRRIEEKFHSLQFTGFNHDTGWAEGEGDRYGAGHFVYPRLGQGAFRVLVTEAYKRRCAITGEKTLPVLEAAHIKPYSLQGPHHPANGILLRKDLHALFDRGYMTISLDYRIEVSKRIKEDFGNGRDYYALHGKKLREIPERVIERPGREFLEWHNQNRYLG
ncbi:MAG: HNH endonuclease [Syntrophomonadaceae bacterium]|nr:HNH endonuclease [Syntrophomonadaceae bacterium]